MDGLVCKGDLSLVEGLKTRGRLALSASATLGDESITAFLALNLTTYR